MSDQDNQKSEWLDRVYEDRPEPDDDRDEELDETLDEFFNLDNR
jgi:hypothetical protein